MTMFAKVDRIFLHCEVVGGKLIYDDTKDLTGGYNYTVSLTKKDDDKIYPSVKFTKTDSEGKIKSFEVGCMLFSTNFLLTLFDSISSIPLKPCVLLYLSTLLDRKSYH